MTRATARFLPVASFGSVLLFGACSSGVPQNNNPMKTPVVSASSASTSAPIAPKNTPAAARQCTFDKVSAHERQPAMTQKDAQICSAECDDGEQAACVAVGTFHMEGNLLPKDPAKAAALFSDACNARFTPGCTRMGLQFAMGLGVPKDPERAVRWLSLGCRTSQPEAEACYVMAFLLQKGEGVKRDDNLASQFYEEACNLDHSDACMRFGDMIPSSNAARKASIYGKACELGSIGGCASLGAAYTHGDGVPEDRVKALQYSTKACDAGNSAACTNVALLFAQGEGGVPKDEPRAAALFEKTCDQGDAPSCSNFGVFLQGGRGVPKDEPRALKFFARSCDADFAAACFKLGFAIENGIGIQKHLLGALKAYQIGCEKGDDDCCDAARRLSRANPGGRR